MKAERRVAGAPRPAVYRRQGCNDKSRADGLTLQGLDLLLNLIEADGGSFRGDLLFNAAIFD